MPIEAIKPAEYKQALLDLIGRRDPLEVAEQTTAAVRELCDGQPAEAASGRRGQRMIRR